MEQITVDLMDGVIQRRGRTADTPGRTPPPVPWPRAAMARPP